MSKGRPVYGTYPKGCSVHGRLVELKEFSLYVPISKHISMYREGVPNCAVLKAAGLKYVL